MDSPPSAIFGPRSSSRLSQIELTMNLSLLDMLKGNTPLEDLANLREAWVEPLERADTGVRTIGVLHSRLPVQNKIHPYRPTPYSRGVHGTQWQ
jgi:hypothetical protein